jgi:transitional endoplasmic reticulum ATPase
MVMHMQERTVSPTWEREFKNLFRAGAGHCFILSGDVHGVTAMGGASQLGYMQATLHTERRDIVIYYHRSMGIQFSLPSERAAALQMIGPEWMLPASSSDLLAALDSSGVAGASSSEGDVFSAAHSPRQALAVLEHLLRLPLANGRIALILDSADLIMPAANKATMREEQLELLAKLLSWGNDSSLGAQNNPVFLLTSQLHDLHPDLRASDSGYKLIDIALPDEPTRYAYITWYLEEHRHGQPIPLLDLSKEDLARNTAGLNLRQVEDILLLGANEDTQEGERRGPMGVTRLLVKSAKDAIIRQQYSDVIEMLDPLPEGFGGLGGMDQLVTVTREEVITPLQEGQMLDVPKGILLVGPPGMGKTRYVQAAAKELGFNAIALRMSKILGGIVGTSERNLAGLFDVARSLAPSFLFIDEIDQSLVGQRGHNSGSPVAANLFGALLVFLGDESIRGKVIVVAATNHPELLDTALKRSGRFDIVYAILPPDESARRSILDVQARLQATSLAPDALSLLAKETTNYSAADLEAVVKEARLLARRAGRTTVLFQDAQAAFENIRPTTLSSVEEFTRHAVAACNNLRYLPPAVAEQERERRRLAAERRAEPLAATVSPTPLARRAREL